MKSAGKIDRGRGRRLRLTAISLVLALHFGITPGQAVAGQVTLAWDSNTEPDVSGYHLYYGTTSGTYAVPINVGKVTTYTVVNLADGQSYFFALTASDTFGNESGYSNEVAYTTPGTGGAPEIGLLGNAASIVDGDTTPAAADHTDFGGASIAGGTITRTFTIKNTGAAALTLSGTALVAVGGANAADFTVTTPPATTVAAAGSTSFQVRFKPGAAGARLATITIASNDANETPYDFAIQGTGTTTPEIDVVGNAVSIVNNDTTPSVADFTNFGDTDITTGTVARTFTIRNTGSGALALSGAPIVAVSGTNAADFVVTSQPVSPVAAGGSTSFQVRFDPLVAGKRGARLTIANNDANESLFRFAVQGTGTNPEIVLYGNGRSIVDGDPTPAGADHTNFGGTDILGGAVTRTFTIRNTGSGALNLSGAPLVAVSGADAADFTVSAQPPSSVAAGASATFQVAFDPGALGTRVATITIASNDLNENPHDFAVKGTGANLPEIGVTGNAVSVAHRDTTPSSDDHTDFGSANIAGGTVTRTFTIRNTGTATLSLTSTTRVKVGGANAPDFKVTVLPPSSVAVGASAPFQVTFDPRAAGTRVATLTIANNDPDENPCVFAIRGTGITPEIDLVGNAKSIVDGDATPSAADHTDFGGTDIAGGAITRTFTIRNTGSDALTLSGAALVAVGGTNASDFTVTTPPATTVAAAGSTTFLVRFDPSAVGTRVATLTIANNDAGENPYNFALRGTGASALADEGPAATSTVAETIAKPAAPSGPASLSAGVTYVFSSHGASSSNGDAVQYRFFWSDGTTSEWLPVGIGEAAKSWATPGTYTQVQVQARCAKHPSVISPVSTPLTVTVGAAAVAETLSRPAAPAGAAGLPAMTTSVFRTGGAISSGGDPLQYRFHWSDGTMSPWLPVGVLEASKSWSTAGSYEVLTEARCALHPSIVSSFSPPLSVSISPGNDEILSGPALPIGPSDGQTGFLYAFDAGGASASSGDPVQYRFQWGDGTASDWVTAEGAAHVRASKFWPVAGRYSVTAEARCSVHPELTIPSETAEVQIVLGDPEMFFDTFAVEAVGDTRWQVVSGGWVVNPDETFATDSQQSDNLAIVGTIPAFTAGRLSTRLRLASGSTNHSAGIVFSYTDAEHYRYVALTGSGLYLGQVGETATEPDGVKVSVPMSVGLDTWHQVRVDVHPDGEIKAYFGQSEVPALTFRFGDSVVGRVGCAANTSSVSFDDFGSWDERVLTP